MPLNVDQTLIDAVKAALLARTALVAGVRDFRWADYASSVQNATQVEPAAYPYVAASASGAGMQRGPTTFGAMLPPSAVVRGIPGRRDITIKIIFDTVDEAEQTPLEAEVEAALHAAGPRLGIRWVASFSYRKTRQYQTNNDTGGRSRLVVTIVLTVDVRPTNLQLAS